MGKLSKALEKANISESKEWPSQEESNEAITNRHKNIADTKAASPNKPIAEKDYISNPVDFRVVVYHNPESLAAEHFKVLRDSIMHSSERKIKSVLITSALEQEGKTMVSCNLAVSIAQSIDPYVLLIDGDVRRPSVQKMLGLKKAKGLTDYLLSGNPLSEYLMKGILDKMTILQAGSTVRNPAELMTSEKMQYLIEEARDRYADRLIVIDSPPVNLAAETLVLARQVDAVVMVVRYGVSDKNAVDEAVNKLGREKILGFVFNGFEVTPRKYTYYKRKYYKTAY